MAAIRDDIGIVEWHATSGDTWARTFTFTEDDPPTFTPIDVTAYTFSAKLYTERGTAVAALATFTVAITDGAAGEISVTLAAATTTSIAAGTYWFEVQWTNGSSVRTPVGGPMIVGSDTV